MKKFILLFIVILSGISGVWAQKYTISGFVTDKANGEKLFGSNI